MLDSGIDPGAGDLSGRIISAQPLHQNLVLNGDFEDGLNSWSIWSGFKPAEITSAALNGSGALRHPKRDSWSLPFTGNIQRLSSFIPGTTYTLSVWGRHTGSGCGGWIGVQGEVRGQRWGSGLWFCETSFTQKSLNFTVPNDTAYVEIYTINSSTRSDLIIDDLSVTPLTVTEAQSSGGDSQSAGLLIGATGTPAAMVDLSREGGVDWVHWGHNGNPSAVNRLHGTARIQMSRVGSSSLWADESPGSQYSWSNGTPRSSSRGNSWGIVASGRGNGFELYVPTSSELRTLRVYLTLVDTQLNTTAYLSDGSSLPYADGTLNSGPNHDGTLRAMYTLTFRGGADPGKLTVRIINDPGQKQYSQVILHAATLSEGSAFPITSVATTADAGDQYGHGTLMAGLIAGDGSASYGEVLGVAPRANLINVRVMDADGKATVADIIRGLEWIYQNHERHNIRVVNMSLNSSVEESHLTSPLSAAVEILWMNKIVVVVSAGNNGDNGRLYPPANDPLVITVGAVDDQATAQTGDDALAAFSAKGKTDVDDAPKPEIVTPGVNLIGAGCPNCLLNRNHPKNVPNGVANGNRYFRASGTSLAAAVVSGAAALVLQANPELDPDQVKYRLMASGGTQFGTEDARYLDIYAAVTGSSTERANQDRTVSTLLYTGENALSNGYAQWGSVNWGSVNWGSVNWGSVNWGSMNMASSLGSSVSSMSLAPAPLCALEP